MGFTLRFYSILNTTRYFEPLARSWRDLQDDVVTFPVYFRELSSTFIKLCDLVDAAKKKVENEIAKLSDEISALEKIESQSRLLGLVNF